MEQIKWLFDKNTRRGRGIRTALQGAFALLTFFAGLVVIPGFGEYLDESGFVAIGTFGVWVGVISYLQNAIEDLLKWLA